jgi:O-antigen/teichoic acid export membrane protein
MTIVDTLPLRREALRAPNARGTVLDREYLGALSSRICSARPVLWRCLDLMVVVPRRVFALGMMVQAFGAVATFATGVAIAWVMGPEAQGRYGVLRAAADLLLALALFGLPQSLIHAIHQQGASPAPLARASARYGAVLLLLWSLAVLSVAGLPLSAWQDRSWTLLALGFAVCGWLVQGLWRMLVLVLGDPLRFAWASVLPALTLLATVLVMLAFEVPRFEWALATSGVASVLLARWQLRTLSGLPAWRQGGAVPLSGLAASGVLAMAPTVAVALQPWLTLMLLQRAGAGDDAIGWFVFASLVQQVFALPASFVAPLLLERVSRAARTGASYPVRPWLPVLGLTVAGALLAALLMPWLVPVAFGAAYEAAVPACIWMAISGPFVVAGRFVAAVLFGRGAFRSAAFHALVRSLAVPAAVMLALVVMPTDRPAAAALAWLVVEVATFAFGAWLARQHAGKIA